MPREWDHRKPTTDPTGTQPPAPDQRPRDLRGVPPLPSPSIPQPLRPLPYPHAHPHAPGRNRPSCAGRGTSTPPASNSRRSPTPQAEGAGQALPLFPFVHFGPSFTEALGLRSACALADTACFPLSTFPTPPSGAVRPPSGQCLAATTCLPLSTCPARLKPKLRRVAPGRTSRKKRAAQFKSTQFGRPRRPLHPCVALRNAGGRRCAGRDTPLRLL